MESGEDGSGKKEKPRAPGETWGTVSDRRELLEAHEDEVTAGVAETVAILVCMRGSAAMYPNTIAGTV